MTRHHPPITASQHRRTIARGRVTAFFQPSRWALSLSLLGLSALPAHAGAGIDDWLCLTQDMTGDDSARAQFIVAVSEASERFAIAPAVLVALKKTETGNGLDPQVIHRNANGSVDRGYFQINVRTWLPELHRIGASIDVQALHGVRSNAMVAAWVLRRELRGRSLLQGIGRYHKGGGDDARARRIRQRYLDSFKRHLIALVKQCQEPASRPTTKPLITQR